MNDDGAQQHTFDSLSCDVADQPPGPRLSHLLAAVDVESADGDQLVELIAAQSRQICFEQARLLAMLNALARPGQQPDAVGRSSACRDPHAASTAAAALAWTEYATATMLDLAQTSVDTIPALHAEMQAGHLDISKLKVIGSELAFVGPEAARTVVEGIIPELPRCTTGQLRRLTRQLVVRTDPEAARARRDGAAERRRVRRTVGPQGTMNVSGLSLPKDKATAAWKNIDARARVAAGADRDKRTIDQLRADVFAELLAGVDRLYESPRSKPERRPGSNGKNVPDQTRAGTVGRGRPRRRRRGAGRESRGHARSARTDRTSTQGR